MSAAINATYFTKLPPKQKTPLLKYLVNLAEQLVLTGRKSARVKQKTNSIGGPRSKRATELFNVGDHLPVESQGRRQCARCAQTKIDKRTRYICAACQVPLCQACFIITELIYEVLVDVSCLRFGVVRLFVCLLLNAICMLNTIGTYNPNIKYHWDYMSQNI